jgi:DNA-binding NtrC family response regulator
MTGKILLVDDDKEVRDMLDAFLKSDGYCIDIADGVGPALKLIDSNDYDIMLIDKNMPGIDGNREGGIDLLRQIRSRSMSAEVIMMTGYPTIDTAMEAIKLGAFDYIPKPFSLSSLRMKIKRLLTYRSFINPEYAIGVYRSIRGKMVELIENRSSMSDNELEQTLLSVNDEIDKLFASFKECERIILTERESLAHIGVLAEQLKMNIPSMNDSYELVEEISRLSENRL